MAGKGKNDIKRSTNPGLSRASAVQLWLPAFFLFGALWAALAVALWLPLLAGGISLPIAVQPVDWHVHELLFGYVPAVIAGFLLTAVPNWTGRLPVVGRPLLALFLTWIAGRIAMLVSAWIGLAAAAAIDSAFLVALGAVVGREIIASNNRHNLKVLAVISLILAANILFHLQALTGTGDGHGVRLGLGAIVMLIMLIGGRIIPSFTRNWLAQRGEAKLPVPFNRFDAGVMVLSAAAVLAWVAAPQSSVTAALALLACIANTLRLSRWAGARTRAEPLVLILHVAYAFVPLGFLLLALAIVRPGLVLPSGALHGWTAGAIGLMTLAVMTRASLGHTGQPLQATPQIQLIYVTAFAAAVARVAAAFGMMREPLLYISAIAWVLAFAGFVAIYAPLLLRPRA